MALSFFVSCTFAFLHFTMDTFVLCTPWTLALCIVHLGALHSGTFALWHVCTLLPADILVPGSLFFLTLCCPASCRHLGFYVPSLRLLFSRCAALVLSTFFLFPLAADILVSRSLRCTCSVHCALHLPLLAPVLDSADLPVPGI